MNPSRPSFHELVSNTEEISFLDQIMPLCYTFSLLLAYAIGTALIITAFCIYREPNLVVVVSEVASPRDRHLIRVIYED